MFLLRPPLNVNHLDVLTQSLRQLLQCDDAMLDTVTPEEECTALRVAQIVKFVNAHLGLGRISHFLGYGGVGFVETGNLGLNNTPGHPHGAVGSAPEACRLHELADLSVALLFAGTLGSSPAAGRGAGIEHEFDNGAARRGRQQRGRAAARRGSAVGGRVGGRVSSGVLGQHARSAEGGKLRAVVDVGLDEAVLLLGRRVALLVAGVRGDGVVVVVGPLGKVVGKLEAARVGGGILKVNDNQLLVLVGSLEKRRLFVVGTDTQNVAVLCLWVLVNQTGRRGFCETHIGVGKDEALANRSLVLVGAVEVGAELDDSVPELWPGCSADIAVGLPGVYHRGSTRPLRQVVQILVKKLHNAANIVKPLVPVLPDTRTSVSLRREQINTVVQLAHSLGNLLHGIRLAQIHWPQCDGVEVLLEATILKGA